MSGWVLILILGSVAVACALLYWQFIIAEGAHLGPRVVVALYDRVATQYDDGIKRFNVETEAVLLGLPLATELVTVPAPRVLDVACGTGRLARALLRELAFDGTVVNLDLAARMLAAGRPTTAAWPGRVDWVRGPADRLPFPAAAFDAVACLEALEFMPQPAAALGECVRVLRPGGLLAVTRRIGWQAGLIVGKTASRAAFHQTLAELGLEMVHSLPWTVDYDLVLARKP